MERYSVKKPQWFSHYFCARPCLYMLENQRNWTKMHAFPQGEATVSSRSHMGVSGETLGSEWKQMLCGFVVSQGLSSSEHTDYAHLHCMNKSFGTQKLQDQGFSSISPFCLSFYLKTGETDVTKLLFLQSVSIPNKEAVSDYLNWATRQWPVEQHSSF